MRRLLIVLALVLVGCKPDPIEACVEAEKKLGILECKNTFGEKECDSDTLRTWITVAEPDWRKRCMRAAAGKED